MGYIRANVRLFQEQERARSRGCNAGVTKPDSGDAEEAQSKVKGFSYLEYPFLGQQYGCKPWDRTVVETRTLL